MKEPENDDDGTVLVLEGLNEKSKEETLPLTAKGKIVTKGRGGEKRGGRGY